MNILYLAHRVPYPPNKGDKLRAYHHLRHLAREHEVHLFAFADTPEETAFADPLREICRTATVLPLRRARALLHGAVSLAGGGSLSEGFFQSQPMREVIARHCAAHPPDLAWAFSSSMAPYLLDTSARRRIADYVDVDSEKWRQYALDSRPPLRWLYALESRRLQALENTLGPVCDRVLFVSEAEATTFQDSAGPAIDVRVVPNGVDTSFFAPNPARTAAGPTLLFTGALDYRPNIDAVTFVAGEILPRLRRDTPDASFVAVGHRPSPSLQRCLQRLSPGVRVAGSVPDVRPYFEQAAVFVAPLRLGRGVQNKILESMAMRVPVVASPLATVGLDAIAGEHLLTARSAEEFAAAAALLLRDPQRATQLADNASRLVHQHYRWQGAFDLLDRCLD